MLLSLPSQAATRNWTGAVDNLWSTPGNWDSGAPAAGDDLYFSTLAQTTNVNDFPAGTSFRTINVSDGPWMFSGNRVMVTVGIQNLATFQLDVTLGGGSQLWFTPCCGTATFTGNIDLNGRALTLRGNTLAGGSHATVIVSGPITGPGSIVASSGTVVFTGHNTYSGSTLSQGLVARSATALGVADGSSANGTTITSALNIDDVAIGNEAIAFDPGAQLYATGTASVNGPLSAPSGGSFISQSGGDLTVNGPITGTTLRALGTGAGATLKLKNASSSFTRLEVLSDVTVILGADGVLPSTADIVLNDGSLDMNNKTSSVHQLDLMGADSFLAGSEPLIVADFVRLDGQLTLTDAFDGTTGTAYTIIRKDAGGPVAGQFDSLPEGGSFTLRGQIYFITYAGGDGNDVVLNAGVLPTVTTLASSKNSANEGTSVTFTATVTASGGTPTGTVTFRDNGTPVFTTSLNGAHQAHFTTAALETGTHPITASYNGSPTHAASSSATLQQVIDDAPPQLAIANTSIVEGSGIVSFEVTLTPATTSPVSVAYATYDLSATQGSDYQTAAGTLTFAAGDTHKTIQVTIVDDSAHESAETFGVHLSNPVGEAALKQSEGMATIVDDDAAFVTTTYEYANIGGRSLLLDLTVPVEGTAPYPVIVWIHPGGWTSGSRMPTPALREVFRGYAVAAVDYRSSGEAKFPAQIADVKAAVRWLRANASQLQIHPQRIGAWGLEAGAHLAALLGTAPDMFDDPAHGNAQFSSRVLAVVEWAGPTNFTHLSDTALPCNTIDQNAFTSQVAQLLGCAIPACTATADQASPVTWASPTDPAFHIVHGTADCSVPPTQAVELFDALQAAGASASLLLADSVGGFEDAYWSSEEALSPVDAFLDAKLKNADLPGRRRAVRSGD
jgi:acetyl esterase/lipase